jgi:hypothetical protein
MTEIGENKKTKIFLKDGKFLPVEVVYNNRTYIKTPEI